MSAVDADALAFASVREIQAALASGATTCGALVAAGLARIAALDDGGPALRAVIAVAPDAMEQAARVDREAAANGRRPLHGIPVLVKDNLDVAGMPTTGGSVTLAGNLAAVDAAVVRRLRGAGAVVLAKTNLTELAVTGTSVGSLRGQVRNPYDPSRTPGGSSGGTGAGIAAGYAALGLGSDTFNSVRSPSSACALVGVRPTRGLVDRAGLMPFGPSQDEIGPMARTAEDASRLLDVIAGRPVTSLDAGAVGGARLGWVPALQGDAALHAPVNAVVARAIEALRAAGAIVEPVVIPGLDGLVHDLGLASFEMAAAMDDYLATRPAALPVRSFAAFVARGEYHPSLLRHFESMLRTPGVHSEAYRVQVARRAVLRAAVLDALDAGGWDGLLFPHQRRLVVPIGEEQVERNGVMANGTGLPSVAFCGGFSAPDAGAPAGVPVGLELLGRDLSERRLLSIAAGYERQARVWRPPAGLA
jgi:amidase